jgi:peptidoglycan/xylan/chitin deacetylase (PgdA/CDA1 family)
MEAVGKYAHPISLSNLVQHLKAGSLPPKAIAVTFDDGYADNLYQARPALEKYDVPATVFVCTGYQGREFWWDELERLVMSSQAGLGTLRLEVGESHFSWKQPVASDEAPGPEVRRQFRRALYHFLLPLTVQDQFHTMDIIRHWAGVSADETAAARALNHTELLQLVAGGLIELGSHTRHHLMLPRISLEQQRVEIIAGKQDLEELLGRPIAGFAYPNGRASGDIKSIVREAGFRFACTSLHNVVRAGSDLYELTRFWQKDVDGDKFMQGLRLWMNMQGRRA